MRNANSSTDPTIYRTIEIRFDKEGKIYACAHDGWTVIEAESVVQIQTFRRGNWRIKVCVYGMEIDYLETFGAYLAASLVDRTQNPVVWRTVELNP